MSFYERFYPKKVFKNVLNISSDFLKENKITVLFLDVDNTLIDYDDNLLEGLENWVENLKKQDIKFCILSNTNKKKKAEKISKLLNIPYIYFALKPLKTGFEKAKNKIRNSEK